MTPRKPKRPGLWVVETTMTSNGEWLPMRGWNTKAVAQERLRQLEVAHPDESYRVVRYVREEGSR